MAKGSKPNRLKHASMMPGLLLKALRERAQVSQIDCARAMGMTSNNAYARYENDPPYAKHGKAIPYKVIEAIAPIIVGRGVPPIGADELWSVSEVKELNSFLPDLAKQVAAHVPTMPTVSVSAGHELTIRYRVDTESFVAAIPEDRVYGESAIVASPRFSPNTQFAALALDNHAVPFGIVANAHVHCVLPIENPTGKIALVAKKVNGYYQMQFAKVSGQTTNGSFQFVSADAPNAPFSAQLLGIVIGAYVSLA